MNFLFLKYQFYIFFLCLVPHDLEVLNHLVVIPVIYLMNFLFNLFSNQAKLIQVHSWHQQVQLHQLLLLFLMNLFNLIFIQLIHQPQLIPLLNYLIFLPLFLVLVFSRQLFSFAIPCLYLLFLPLFLLLFFLLILLL